MVGLTTEETLIAGECKFQSAPLGYGALSQLEDHVEELRWTPQDGSERVERYALGFKQSVMEAAAERNEIRLITMEDVTDVLSEK